MTDPNNPEALTDDGRAPVLSEDQAEAPVTGDPSTTPIDLPMEENDFNAQPG